MKRLFGGLFSTGKSTWFKKELSEEEMEDDMFWELLDLLADLDKTKELPEVQKNIYELELTFSRQPVGLKREMIEVDELNNRVKVAESKLETLEKSNHKMQHDRIVRVSKLFPTSMEK
ncbi:hypothetical protein EIN_176690 [Entamoeba invadens IP1]|uniref:hypothetical protein n=1 Tax=Entamoeba invadens IP1 TaxID=370355 RepID=UPI0002C3F557|nr:hypothetical protein EIN_176690 [Entamoeba invadens IP1]ELP93842.1 hypothetical protein EIN_176690 [Entamoeba invadens IP1]|eukprot:XP_004260613.1 hypothetical protein EIN_176690 [Entamoeba invadens IP1]